MKRKAAGPAEPAGPADDEEPQSLRLFLHRSLRHLSGRLPRLRDRLRQLGASAVVAGDPLPAGSRRLTHIVLQVPPQGSDRYASDCARVLANSGSPEPEVVDTSWLEALLSSGTAPPSSRHAASPEFMGLVHARMGGGGAATDHTSSGGTAAGTSSSKSSSSAGTTSATSDGASSGGLRLQRQLAAAAHAPFGRYQRWLGYWTPSFDHIPELMLQARYSIPRSAQLGNETVVSLLRELAGYEEALSGSKGDPGQTHNVNTRALAYAHCASAVRACSFSLRDLLPSESVYPSSPSSSSSSSGSREPHQQHHGSSSSSAVAASLHAALRGAVPYMGAFTAAVVTDLLLTGTCDQLECFRQDQPVRDSRGALRPGSEGGRTRRLFVRLPGVGHVQALAWWRLGLRSYEDVEAAAQPGGPLAPGSGHALPREVAFCLRHRADLVEGEVGAEEVEEMRKALEAAAEELTGLAGWQAVLVGGGRRAKTAHDADFLLTHAGGASTEGLVPPLVTHLMAQGRLVSPEEGFCRLQTGNLPGYLEQARADVLAGRWPNRHQMDRYDHIYGVYVTQQQGRRRRMDVILVPWASMPMALVGWTGSKAWLRFMRQHASNCGMLLNSHFMFRKAGPAAGRLVPQEAPPLDAQGREFWPPGWEAAGKRSIECEADLFALLRIPNLPPDERNAP